MSYSVYLCEECGCEMCEKPTKEYGRCPNCGHKLYPDGYEVAIVNYDPPKIYPAPSWEDD